MRDPNLIEEDFNKLRRILLKPTAQRLDHLEERVDSIEGQLHTLPTAEDVGTVLPEAVRLSVRKGPGLATSLAPVVEAGLDQSIARNKDRVISVLYPIVGTMIRKSIVEGLRDAISSINTTLERALSLEGLKWRWESFRTGIPISQIAFKHSIVFRTEHIFLIHNETAQPLLHLSVPEAVEADKLVFAGMVSAITDFIKDAFYRNEPIGLRSIDIGEFTVWFEEGPSATIAVVIRGEPQPILRSRLRRTSENLHSQYATELQNSMVDEISTLGYDSLLRDGLMQQRRPQPGKRKHSARLVMGAAGLILTALIIVGVSNYLHERFRDARFDRFISQVRRSDDVLITDYGKRDDGKYFVAGFATGSMPVLPVGDFGLKPDDVEVRLINHVFAVDHSNSGLQLQAFRDHLDQINGTPWPTIDSPAGQAWIESTTDHIANAYLQGRALGRAFIVVIEHPRRLKPAADQLSGRIAWRLYREGIYEPHLVRTLAVDAAPPVIRVLEERTVGK